MSEALQGDLKDFSMSNIVQINCVEKNSAQVTIETRTGPAAVFLDRGDIVHASYNELKGEEAFYRILRLTEGKFKVSKETEIPPRTIHTSWSSLLLDGMRVMDETSRTEQNILRHLGEKLKDISGILSVSLYSHDGNQIFLSDHEDRLQDYAIARLIDEEADDLTRKTHIGNLRFTLIIVDKKQVFITRFQDIFLVITAGRDLDLTRIQAIVDSLNDRLKENEGGQGSE